MKATRISYILFALILVISCESPLSPNKDIQEMVDSGEKIYAAKIDDVKVLAGLNRIKISGVLKYGMDTESCTVTWMPGNGRAVVPVERIEEEDQFSYYINNLDEGTYDFQITTTDRGGHESIPTSVSGKAYGKRYLSTLRTRSVAMCEPEGSSLTVTFAVESQDAIQTLFTYYDKDGSRCEVIVPKTTDEIVLTSWMPESEYMVQTFYSPEADAIDEFTVSEKGMFPEEPVTRQVVLVNKRGYKELILDSDIRLNAWAGALYKGWDGDKSATNFAHSDNTAMKELPFWYTFDLGQECQLCKYIHWGNPTENRIFDGGSLRKWEIYGRADKPEADTWDGWIKLASCESMKPSGQPNGQNTQEDRNRWFAGEEFEIPVKGVPTVRYIRIKVLDTWSGEGWILFSEFEFYKYE